MIFYLAALFLVFLLAYVAQTKQTVLEDGVIRKTNRIGKLAIAAVCVVLILIGGLRKNVGSDFGVYWNFFRGYGSFPGYMNMSLWDTFQADEGGFWAIATVVGWFTKDEQVVFFVCQAIIVLCIVPTLAKYSNNLSLSVFLYLATFDYFSSFNGVRQWVAAAIVFASLPLLKERKMIRYFLLCLFAYTFHNTAILMIPVGLFVLTKPTSKWNILGLTAVGFLFFFFPSTFESILGGIVEDKYTQFIDMEGDGGVNVLRILVAAVPVVLTRVFYRRLYEGEEDKKFLDVLINLSTVNFVFLFVATRGTYFARMGMYVSVSNCLLIPYLLRVFKKESRVPIKAIIMAMFALYLIMLLPVEAMVLPYQNVFGWKFV